MGFGKCNQPLEGSTLWADITATNADLPKALEPGSVLDPDGGGAACTARLLHRPTPARRFDLGGDAALRLLSHLSANHLWLSGSGIEAIRDMLGQYDLPRDAASQRLVQGLQSIDTRAANALLFKGEPYMARGNDVRLTVEDGCFGDTGPLLFAWVMERWFAQLAYTHSFARLQILSACGTELFAGKARAGTRPLL